MAHLACYITSTSPRDVPITTDAELGMDITHMTTAPFRPGTCRCCQVHAFAFFLPTNTPAVVPAINVLASAAARLATAPGAGSPIGVISLTCAICSQATAAGDAAWCQM